MRMNTIIRPRFAHTSMAVSLTVLQSRSAGHTYGVELVVCDISGRHRLRSLGGMSVDQARDLAEQLNAAADQAENYSGPIPAAAIE